VNSKRVRLPHFDGNAALLLLAIEDAVIFWAYRLWARKPGPNGFEPDGSSCLVVLELDLSEAGSRDVQSAQAATAVLDEPTGQVKSKPKRGSRAAQRDKIESERRAAATERARNEAVLGSSIVAIASLVLPLVIVGASPLEQAVWLGLRVAEAIDALWWEANFTAIQVKRSASTSHQAPPPFANDLDCSSEDDTEDNLGEDEDDSDESSSSSTQTDLGHAWWRPGMWVPTTAAYLHRDPNAGFGLLVAMFVTEAFGRGLATPLTVSTVFVLGSLVVTVVDHQRAPHNSTVIATFFAIAAIQLRAKWLPAAAAAISVAMQPGLEAAADDPRHAP